MPENSLMKTGLIIGASRGDGSIIHAFRTEVVPRKKCYVPRVNAGRRRLHRRLKAEANLPPSFEAPPLRRTKGLASIDRDGLARDFGGRI